MESELTLWAVPKRPRPPGAKAPRRPRPWTIRRPLFTPTRPIITVEDLHAEAEERLAALLLELASWDREDPSCVVSDSTFLVVSFLSKPGVGPYVQFLSTPSERTVLWEVASLDYGPDLADLLTQRSHGILTARGFAKGRRTPANYQREVVVEDIGAARAVARESLDVLFEVFAYRGEQPLTIFYVGERQAQSHILYPQLTPGELALLLRRNRFEVTVADPEAADAPRAVLFSNHGGVDARLTPTLKGKRGGFREYVGTARFAAHPRLTDRFVHEWNAGGAGNRLVLEPDGSAVLRITLPLYRGIGETQIVGSVGDFECEVRTLSAALGPG